MTSPLAHDQPDWQRTVSAHDIEVYNASPVLGAGANTLGTFFVGNLPSIQIAMGVDGGGAKVDFIWMGDSSGLKVLARNSVHTRFTIDAQGSLPALGPWLRIQATPDAAGRTLALLVNQSLSLGQDTRLDVPNQLMRIDLVAVASGAVVNFDASWVRWGMGYWHAHFELGSVFRMRLQAVDYLNVTRMIDFIPSSVAMTGKVIFIPAMQLRLQVLQLDGVNRDLLATVLLHPGPT